ncbi:PIN domain-containing protein [Candidatus Woesearchaeota archaeon]|nr:PIN domain-containing protein [Candidatus Woesearchaeota archaeon]
MTESKDLFLIDSNILVYAFEKEESIKKDKAKNILNQCIFGTRDFAISNQNLAEFVFATTKKGKLDVEEAKNLVIKMTQFEGFKKINYNAKTIHLALSTMQEFKASFWDSLLVATMRENGIFNIYTENVKDFKMPWINAVNPFT